MSVKYEVREATREIIFTLPLTSCYSLGRDWTTPGHHKYGTEAAEIAHLLEIIGRDYKKIAKEEALQKIIDAYGATRQQALSVLKKYGPMGYAELPAGRKTAGRR